MPACVKNNAHNDRDHSATDQPERARSPLISCRHQTRHGERREQGQHEIQDDEELDREAHELQPGREPAQERIGKAIVAEREADAENCQPR